MDRSTTTGQRASLAPEAKNNTIKGKVKAALGTQQWSKKHEQPNETLPRVPLSKGTAEELANIQAPEGQASASQSQAINERPEHSVPISSDSSNTLRQHESPSASTTDRRWMDNMRSRFNHKDNLNEKIGGPGEKYDQDTVDWLDVIDPEVSTISTLTNVQNSLFVPSMGRYLDRRPAYRLSSRPEEVRTIDKLRAAMKLRRGSQEEGQELNSTELLEIPTRSIPRLARSNTITSTLSESRYAVLPHGETLPGWTHDEKLELDDMVRHMLHSRRARMKRTWKGFRQYVRRPLGLFVTVYATLITLFGAAWVLFLIGWLSVGSKKDYVVNVVDNVLVALFAVMGDGLAPFRAVDTYHMIYIAHYHRKTLKKRKDLGLPELADPNDLPEARKEENQTAKMDIESLVARRIPNRLARFVAPRIPKKFAQRMVDRSNEAQPSYEYTVLTEEEQAKLEFHERKFSKSHTFYKPHETETHFAFPLKLLIAIVILLDCHSCLQISLGACTWGIPYETRPFALTTVILCCSITCNITGGVLISMGDKKTRKKDVIERMMRQELTSEAIQSMETNWLKQAEERGIIDKSVRKQLAKQREEAENEEVKDAWKVVPSLPKTLLGKGVDHRQPSLPQEERRSSSSVRLPDGTDGKHEKKKIAQLPAVQEKAGSSVPRPQPALTRKPVAGKSVEGPKEGFGQKALRTVRRADLDRS